MGSVGVTQPLPNDHARDRLLADLSRALHALEPADADHLLTDVTVFLPPLSTAAAPATTFPRVEAAVRAAFGARAGAILAELDRLAAPARTLAEAAAWGETIGSRTVLRSPALRPRWRSMTDLEPPEREAALREVVRRRSDILLAAGARLDLARARRGRLVLHHPGLTLDRRPEVSVAPFFQLGEGIPWDLWVDWVDGHPPYAVSWIPPGLEDDFARGLEAMAGDRPALWFDARDAQHLPLPEWIRSFA